MPPKRQFIHRPSGRDSEEAMRVDDEGIDDDSIAGSCKKSADDSGYGTASNTNYDGQSTYSDGGHETVPKPVRPGLVKLLSDEIRKNLDEGILESISAQDHGVDLISAFILEFAERLEVELIEREGDFRRKATRFAKHHRTDIAGQMMQSKSRLKLDWVNQLPLEDMVNNWSPVSAGPPETGEPNEQLWDLSTTYPEKTYGLNPLTLSDVPEAQEYLTKSQQFQWLLERIRSLASPTQTRDEISSMQTAILKAVGDNAEALELTLDWDPLALLSGQYHEGSLSRLIVYNGSQSTCYATTVEEYVREIWPDCHPLSLLCFERAIVSSDHIASSSSQGLDLRVEFHDRETSVILSRSSSGDPYSRKALLEVAGMCIWLATACRDYEGSETIGLSSLLPSMEEEKPVSRLVMKSIVSHAQYGNIPQGQCWMNMVRNPVIAVGYPVPKRDDALRGKGLELSISLMATLSRVSRLTTFDDLILFKGATTALVPAWYTDSVIVWHFLINKDAEPMTYDRAIELAVSTPDLDASDLGHRRHYVGFWCSEAHMAVGSEAGIYDLHKATSEPVNDWTISLATLSFNGGQWFTAGAAFNILKKDVSLAHLKAAAQSYDHQLKRAGKISVLFYSSDDRRAWLVDGASALVHLARAYLVSDMAEHKSPDAIGNLRHIQGNGGVAAAIGVLKDNRSIHVFEESHNTVEKMTTRIVMSASHRNSECSSGEQKVFITKSSVRTYEDVVVDLWEHLQEMKAKVDRLKRRSLEKNLRMPGSRLLGWDVTDVIRSSDMMAPQYIRLQPDGAAWLPFTREISSIVLMARNFGDLIIPSPGPQLCKNMTELPRGRDLLAIPQYILATTGESFLAYQNRDDNIRISDKTYLHGYDPSHDGCRCDSSSTRCKNISELLTTARPKKRYPSTLRTFLDSPRAAIVVGTLPGRLNLLEKVRWRENQDASTSARRKELNRNGLQAGPRVGEGVVVIAEVGARPNCYSGSGPEGSVATDAEDSTHCLNDSQTKPGDEEGESAIAEDGICPSYHHSASAGKKSAVVVAKDSVHCLDNVQARPDAEEGMIVTVEEVSGVGH